MTNLEMMTAIRLVLNDRAGPHIAHQMKEHFADTPKRWLKVLSHYFQPYIPEDDLGVVFETFRDESLAGREEPEMFSNSFVLQKNIPYRGLCAHHLLPVMGKAHVAYIPCDKVVGLSKLARVVYGFSHETPDVQERVGERIVSALLKHLDPWGAAVIIEAEHTCMSARGVEEHGVTTTTAALRGVFATDASARNELYMNIAR